MGGQTSVYNRNSVQTGEAQQICRCLVSLLEALTLPEITLIGWGHGQRGGGYKSI